MNQHAFTRVRLLMSLHVFMPAHVLMPTHVLMNTHVLMYLCTYVYHMHSWTCALSFSNKIYLLCSFAECFVDYVFLNVVFFVIFLVIQWCSFGAVLVHF